MSYTHDSRDWYVSDSLEIWSTFFHLGVTEFGCMFDRRNALTLSQKFVTLGLLPLISYKWCMQLSMTICPPSSPRYVF